MISGVFWFSALRVMQRLTTEVMILIRLQRSCLGTWETMHKWTDRERGRKALPQVTESLAQVVQVLGQYPPRQYPPNNLSSFDFS